MQGYASRQKPPETPEELVEWARELVKALGKAAARRRQELMELEDYYFAADKAAKIAKALGVGAKPT